MSEANAQNRNAYAGLLRAENAGCLFSRAAFVSAVSMPAMRMRMHAERMDAVKAAL